jgi:glycosyltransferase involved in cell wall biosynthesis
MSLDKTCFKSPLISVIIPTYNRAHLISQTLESVMVQTYSNWECIIIDDNSTDDSHAVINAYLQKDSRFHYYERPVDLIKGASSCRNYGFLQSKGDYIQFFDSDDLYYPTALEEYVKDTSENSDAVVAKLEKVDFTTGIKLGESKTITTDNVVEDYLMGKISFYVCGPLWNKEFLNRQSYLFDEDISNWDDWDFNLRMLYQAPTIIYLDKVLIKYRFHSDSLSKEIFKLNFEEILSQFKALENHIKLIEQNKLADIIKLKNFSKNNCKHILRATLVNNNEQKAFFYKILLKKQKELGDYKGIFKCGFGYILFGLFNKGYFFFK